MKGVIIEVDIYSAIRTRYQDVESIRSIAKAFNVSRQTVKKYCEGSTHPDERKIYEREPDVITDDVKAFITSCFKEDDDEKLKKQKHTAKKIYDRLVSEKNFNGSYSTIRTSVRNLKAQRTFAPKSSIPLSYTPGKATIYLDGKNTKVIPSAVDYVIAVTYLYKFIKLLMKKPF